MGNALEPLGIRHVEAIHYYVADLERSRRFYTEKLDFAEVAESTRDLEDRARQRSLLFAAGECRVLCSTPMGRGGRAWRFLQKHPDGVGSIIFAVEDIERAFRLLEERGANTITEVQTFTEGNEYLRTFAITTPFGSATFRFVERSAGYPHFMPGVAYLEQPRGGNNAFGFGEFDHITSNFETLMPMILWLEHVMGLEEYWRVQFHTDDVAPNGKHGSGLRSRVMWDPHSQKVKFANNEPIRPYFKQSQINIFYEDHRGDGVQHAALTTPDIIETVRGLRERGVKFMPTPGTYYDMLPERLEKLGVGRIDEDLDVLRDLEILVDGKGPNQYLLQIFLQDSQQTHDDPQAGPFFFEIIQRKGDKGFGEGNFRALFESIERQHRLEGRI